MSDSFCWQITLEKVMVTPYRNWHKASPRLFPLRLCVICTHKGHDGWQSVWNKTETYFSPCCNEWDFLYSVCHLSKSCMNKTVLYCTVASPRCWGVCDCRESEKKIKKSELRFFLNQQQGGVERSRVEGCFWRALKRPPYFTSPRSSLTHLTDSHSKPRAPVWNQHWACRKWEISTGDRGRREGGRRRRKNTRKNHRFDFWHPNVYSSSHGPSHCF